MATLVKYQAAGFYPIDNVAPTGLISIAAAASVNIAKGDAIHYSTGATNATTSFVVGFLGVAAEACDNSSGALGALNCLIIPHTYNVRFSVPVEQAALITEAAIGTLVDLQSVNTIDLGDTTIATGPGFYVEEIDTSAAAVAANTFGYAIGRFRQTD